jgi:hypothetical protein
MEHLSSSKRDEFGAASLYATKASERSAASQQTSTATPATAKDRQFGTAMQESKKRFIDYLERQTGVDIDGDGKIGGSDGPTGRERARGSATTRGQEWAAARLDAARAT